VIRENIVLRSIAFLPVSSVTLSESRRGIITLLLLHWKYELMWC